MPTSLTTHSTRNESNINGEFWHIPSTDDVAIYGPGDNIITYAQLNERVTNFRDRLNAGRGLLSIVCDGSLEQYIAYLAGLSGSHPVLLLPPDKMDIDQTYPVMYRYHSSKDQLDINKQHANAALHPELALLLSTSGTTGASKCVKLSRANLAANATSIATYLNLSNTDRAPLALPFSYSYGMSLLNSHLAVGASLVLIEGSVSEAHFWNQFRIAGCTSLAGVPYSFHLMKQARIRTDEMPKLRYMTQAGGKLSPTDVSYWAERSRTEGWQFFVMYGQTEASPRISYLPPELALSSPSSIGVPVPGGKLKIELEEGIEADDGHPGELVYEGPNVMMGYAFTGEDLATEPGPQVLRTGDMAVRHPNGLYEIVGRRSRFVKLFGLRISLDEIESRLSKDGLVAAASSQLETIQILVEGDQKVRGRAVGIIQSWLSIPENNFAVVTTDKLPRLSSGKLDRRTVKEVIQAQLEEQPSQDMESSGTGGSRKSVYEIFQQHLSRAGINRKLSFRQLGGDSLTFVAISIDLEKALGELPDRWDEIPIEQLETIKHTKSFTVSIDTPTILRAVAILLIASAHIGIPVPGYSGGGADLLFVVAGWSFATFSLESVLRTHSVRPLISLIVRVAIPTLIYTAVTDVVTGYGEFPAYFLVGNWISPNLEGSAWFIDVYIQILLLMIPLLSLAKVRDQLIRRPYLTTLTATCISIGLATIFNQLFDTSDLFRRLPHLHLWMLLTGATTALAYSTRNRFLAMAAFCTGSALWAYFKVNPNGIFEALSLRALAYEMIPGVFLVGGLLLLWVRNIPVPRLFAPALRHIASASLFIYLTHIKLAEYTQRLLGFESPAIGLVVALSVGVLLWRAYGPIDRFIGGLITRVPSRPRNPTTIR